MLLTEDLHMNCTTANQNIQFHSGGESPLYRWRVSNGFSSWTIAEQVANVAGKDTSYWAILLVHIEKGIDDPQSIQAGPLWDWIWNHGGEGLDVQMVKWVKVQP